MGTESKAMRILHVVPSYLPATRYGGPIYSVHGLCRALAVMGHEVHVFTTSVDGKVDSDVPLGRAVALDGVQVWYFPAGGMMRRLYYSPDMLRALREQVPAFDLVHLHSVFLWPTWAAARVARSAGMPYVLSPRGMLVRELIKRRSRWVKTAWVGLVERVNIAGAAAIHVTSDKEAAELQKFRFRLPAVWVVPNGIDAAEPWSADEVSEDVRTAIAEGGYVLFFGRINWKKGLDRLLAAWKGVSGARLIIAGNDEENYLAELQGRCLNNDLSATVTFLPRHISGADKEVLLASARLFVLPSYSENFGNTVLEAMIRSVPVVVTEEVGAGEVVRESGGGRVVSADQLAGVLSALLQDQQGLAKMGIRGCAWVKERYSWSGIADEMTERYRGIIHA